MSKMLRFRDIAFLDVPISQVKLAPRTRWRSLRFARNYLTDARWQMRSPQPRTILYVTCIHPRIPAWYAENVLAKNDVWMMNHRSSYDWSYWLATYPAVMIDSNNMLNIWSQIFSLTFGERSFVENFWICMYNLANKIVFFTRGIYTIFI